MNLYKRLKNLLPDAPLLVGEVVAFDSGTAIVELPDGAQVTARGTASVSDRVFVRDGLIEGPAPSLSVELIEV